MSTNNEHVNILVKMFQYEVRVYYRFNYLIGNQLWH